MSTELNTINNLSEKADAYYQDEDETEVKSAETVPNIVCTVLLLVCEKVFERSCKEMADTIPFVLHPRL